MATFEYKAKTSSGETVTGKFDANDKNMVVSILRSKGMYPISIEENVSARREVKLINLKKVSIKDFAIFCRQFQTMINAGVPVLGCLDMLRKQTENAKLAEVLNRIYDDVQKGKSLSASMKEYDKVFPVILTSMVEVGEVSGTLDAVMERLSVHFEKENKMNQKIAGAMAYPMAISAIALIMVVFMMTFVVPQFVSMFNAFGGTLPWPTQMLLNISGLISNPVFLLTTLAAISVFVYIINKVKATDNGKYIYDSILMKIPILGKNLKKIIASRFTRTLSSLLNSGVPFIQSLEVTDRVVSNQIVSRGMVKVIEDIRRGSNLAGPLDTVGIFPPMVINMIKIGEETGSLDAIMEKAADFYDDEVDAAINQIIGLLQPIMIFVLAAVVGSIIIAMVLPIFTMMGNIGK